MRFYIRLFRKMADKTVGNNMKKIFIIIFMLFAASIFANTAFSNTTQIPRQNLYDFSSPVDTQRFQSLTQEIRCVVCQSQSIADSNAPLAKDLRNKVYEMVLEKKSNEEIKNYLAKRYGEFILLRPRLNKLTVALWVFPVLACFFVFF